MVDVELCCSILLQGGIAAWLGEEGNQKAFIFSPFRLCLYCQKPPCLNKPQSSQGRSHPAPDQDGGYKGPAILCIPETALTNNIVPEIPARLPEAA